MWYCLPDSLSLFVYNPETASRVTLAALGTVFQTDNQTTKQLNNHPARQLALSGCFVDVLTRLWLTRHIQKSITDNPDATDLFFSRIFIVSCWISMRLSGAGIVTD